MLLAAGCAASRQPAQDPHPFASLARLASDPKGVCASAANLDARPWSPGKRDPAQPLGDRVLHSAVQACARVEPGAGGPGEGSELAVALVFPEQDEHWRPEHWHVEVIREDGLVVLATSLGPGRIEDGSCVLDACEKEGHAAIAMSEPWQVGRYRIWLTHVPTRKRIDLAITLN